MTPLEKSHSMWKLAFAGELKGRQNFTEGRKKKGIALGLQGFGWCGRIFAPLQLIRFMAGRFIWRWRIPSRGGCEFINVAPEDGHKVPNDVSRSKDPNFYRAVSQGGGRPWSLPPAPRCIGGTGGHKVWPRNGWRPKDGKAVSANRDQTRMGGCGDGKN